MDILLGIIVLVATTLAMEGVAYASHRWVMHGPGWFLHESHHGKRTGLFELNDLYALIFAMPSILLIYGGVNLGWSPLLIWVGAGIACYGLIYFGFHDVIVHHRIDHRYVARSGYMKRIVQAHRLHHASTAKHGGVSFGFIWARSPHRLKEAFRTRDVPVKRLS